MMQLIVQQRLQQQAQQAQQFGVQRAAGGSRQDAPATDSGRCQTDGVMYTRLQTVWSLPGPSRQDNKGHSPRCHRRSNGPGRLADKVAQPTTQSAEGCTYKCRISPYMCDLCAGAVSGTSGPASSLGGMLYAS